MFSIFTDYTFLIVVLSCAVLAAASSAIGLIIILQKESLVGDALSHAALPGVVVGFLILQEKNTLMLLLGAFISGIVAVGLIYGIKNNTKLPFDGILAVVLSSFFGLGMVLLTYAQKMPNAAQAGLKSFIFGQASGILQEDVKLIGIVAVLAFLVIGLFWKELKIFVFDPLFSYTAGFKRNIMQGVISVVMMIVIITELQTVGIILTSAMLVAPGVAALQWSKSFSKAMLLSVSFGIISAFVGTTFSAIFSNVPTGPAIVVVMTSITLGSIYFGSRGVLQQKLHQKKYRKQVIEKEVN